MNALKKGTEHVSGRDAGTVSAVERGSKSTPVERRSGVGANRAVALNRREVIDEALRRLAFPPGVEKEVRELLDLVLETDPWFFSFS